jgi:ABC-type nitrate/sulfonate/bicarbonate transport system substrate-binding protein
MTATRRDLLRGFAASFAVATPFLLAECGPEPKRAGVGKPLSMQASWANDAEFIGYFVAIAKGWYEAGGLAFEYLQGGPETVSDEVLAKRQCDVALTNIDGTVDAVLKQGAPFKVIGTQYQKSPLGVVSLAANNIRSPKDLVGKRLAVPDANRLTVAAFLRLNNIDPNKVDIVNYLYDPDILVKGTVDATVDFVTNVPYAIRLEGVVPNSFLFADFGFEMFMDTMVVSDETLRTKRQELVSFLRASRKGWEENFKDIGVYPEQFKDSFYGNNGRTVDNEKYFNEQQKPLIESPSGIFSMSAEGIDKTRESLARIGLKAPADLFVTDLLREV